MSSQDLNFTDEWLDELRLLVLKGLEARDEASRLEARLAIIYRQVAANDAEIAAFLGLGENTEQDEDQSQSGAGKSEYRGDSRALRLVSEYVKAGQALDIPTTFEEAMDSLTHSAHWRSLEYPLRQGRQFVPTPMGDNRVLNNLSFALNGVLTNLERYWRGESGAHSSLAAVGDQIATEQQRKVIRRISDLLIVETSGPDNLTGFE